MHGGSDDPTSVLTISKAWIPSQDGCSDQFIWTARVERVGGRISFDVSFTDPSWDCLTGSLADVKFGANDQHAEVWSSRFVNGVLPGSMRSIAALMDDSTAVEIMREASRLEATLHQRDFSEILRNEGWKKLLEQFLELSAQQQALSHRAEMHLTSLEPDRLKREIAEREQQLAELESVASST